MRQIKVLFYVDSGTMLTHCITVAEVMRRRTGAEIIMMIVDSVKYHDVALKNYQIYDYGTLFRRTKKVGKIPPVLKPKKSFSFALPQSLPSIRSLFRANEDG